MSCRIQFVAIALLLGSSPMIIHAADGANELAPTEQTIHAATRRRVRQAHLTGNPAHCDFEPALPSNFVVLAAGGYGGRPTTLQIDQSGHEATEFTIAVNYHDHPVVLMLGAYEPAIWDVAWTPGTNIAAVWVGGYHRQIVLGVNRRTPILNASYEENRTSGCQFYFSGEKELARANELTQRTLSTPIAMFYPLPPDRGQIVVGDAFQGNAKLVSSSHLTLEDVIDKNAPLAGQAGLDDAVSKGLIRRARAEDFEAYSERHDAKFPPPALPPIAGQPERRRRTHYSAGYVVLTPFTYPAGLYGAHSTTFIIADGVPLPSGNPGHSRVLDMNTGDCLGAICEILEDDE